MKIAIIGAGGFIGKHLMQTYLDLEIETISLGKSDFVNGEKSIVAEKLNGCNVVINLAGANISKRWNESYKELIYNSRINTTNVLVAAINSLEQKPEVLISASAVGYYPSLGVYTEYDTVNGSDFLAKVCADWEKEAAQLDSSVRLVITRFGVVLSANGGALPRMVSPFNWGLGIKIGTGNDNISWIHLADLLSAMLYVIEHKTISGVVNFVAPEFVTNKRMNREIARIKGVICCVPIPKFIFKIMLADGACILIDGKSVIPKKLLDAGYEFKFQNIENALTDLLK